MIIEQFYINTDIDRACELTGMALDELELLVGRFGPNSRRRGLLKGQVVVYADNRVELRTCFGFKLICIVDTDMLYFRDMHK